MQHSVRSEKECWRTPFSFGRVYYTMAQSSSLLRTFSKYVSLNVLGMISLSGYILADTFFIAKKLGAQGLAALNLSIPIYSVIHGIGLMIAIGGATRFSIRRSQGNKEGANAVFSTALRVGLLLSLLFVVAGIFASGSLAGLLGADETTLPMTKTYLSMIMIFAPFFITNNVVLAFVRNDDDPNLAMIAMLAGSFSNIILDYVFMFPLDMGMFGAVLATCLAPLISLGVLSSHFAKHKDKFVMFRNKPDWGLLPDICALGSSALIVELSSAVVLITFNLVILGLRGNTGVAAYGIVANLGLVGVAMFTGLSQGAQPLVSRLYGTKSLHLAKKVRGYALKTAFIMAIIMYLVVIGYADSIVSLFNSEGDADIGRMAVRGLRIYFIGFFFLGVNVVEATYLSATENPRDAFLISMARGIVIIIPLVLILSRLWDMIGVWLAFGLTELSVTVLTMALRRSNMKASDKLQASSQRA